MERPKLKRDWVGLKVKTLRKNQHHNGSIPAGTEGIVQRNFGGLDIEVAPCEHCGKGFFIRKVPEKDVVLIK